MLLNRIMLRANPVGAAGGAFNPLGVAEPDESESPLQIRTSGGSPLHLSAATVLKAAAGTGALFSAPEQRSASNPPLSLDEEGIKIVPLSNFQYATFQQSHRGIPVRGAQVAVGFDQAGTFVEVNGHVAESVSVDPLASVSPRAASQAVSELLRLPKYQGASFPPPSLAFWEDRETGITRLVYCFSPIAVEEAILGGGTEENSGTILAEILVDAHSGWIAAILPLTASLNAAQVSGRNNAGVEITLPGSRNENGVHFLDSAESGIFTRTMQFSDLNCGPLSAPGAQYSSNSNTFNEPDAITAHQHIHAIVEFFRQECQHPGPDGKGGPTYAALQCLNYRQNALGFCRPANAQTRVWPNAMWYVDDRPNKPPELRKGLLVFGQEEQNGSVVSYSRAFDIVAHEFSHGVIHYTCRLDYTSESGAMNESIADTFAVIASNVSKPSVAEWDWGLGEELSPEGRAARNLSDPQATGLPAHFDAYKRLHAGEMPGFLNDWGNVHHNSSIPSKAAHLLLTSPAFTWRDVTKLYYLALATPGRLSRSATFQNLRGAVTDSCTALFAADPHLNEKAAAVRAAFDAVGIREI